jgi:peptidoglycan/xylan/chitin deacetylase (PgdA/CDA1 family)
MMKTTKEVFDGISIPRSGPLKWIPILMYHHVVPRRHQGLGHVEVTVQEFEQQMKYLKDHGYRAMHLAEAARVLGLGKSAVDRPVVITFDDGYLDVYHHAFPILKKFNFTADLFLVSSYLDRPGSHAGAGGPMQPLGMTHIEEMADCGLNFGSHSITHRRLTLLSPQESWEEIQGSRLDLERRLGLPVDSFSFPHGCSNPALKRMVGEAGYLTACGIEQREHELFNLSRIDASRCRGADLRWQLRTSGMYFGLRRRNSLRRLKDFIQRRKPRLGEVEPGPAVADGDPPPEPRLKREPN